MSPRLHLVGGGESYLPLAKNMLRKLKLTGLAHATQKYEVDGVSIRVSIVDGQEHIYISGGSPDYLVRQTNAEKYDSEDLHGVRFDGTSVRVKPTSAEAGRHDWVSQDGKNVVTFDNGASMRYEVGDVGTGSSGLPFMFVNGAKLTTEYGIKGACLLNATVDDVKYRYVIFASYEDFYHFDNNIGATRVCLYFIDRAAPKNEDKTSVCTKFAEYNTPSTPASGSPTTGQVVCQPTFFSGDGLKAISVLATVTATNLGSFYVYNYGGPFYILRATIAVGVGGIPTATFSATVHPTSNADVTTGTDSSSGPLGLNFIPPVTVATNYFDGPDGLPSGSSQTTTGTRTTSSYASRSRNHEVIGADLTSAGDEKIITRLRHSLETSGSFESVSGNREEVRTWYFDGDGFLVSDLSGNAAQTYTLSTTGANGSFEDIAINGGVIISVNVNGTDNVSSGYSLVSNTTIHNFSDETVTNTETNSSNPGENRFRKISLRDLDARISAIALVLTTHPITGALNCTSKSILKIEGTTTEKTFFSGVVPILPPNVEGNHFLYNVFASRKPGEYMACLSACTSLHEANEPTNTDELLNWLSQYGTVDRDPIIKFKPVDAEASDPLKEFKLSTGAAFRFDPVKLL